jgi:Uma2 family endonuclease
MNRSQYLFLILEEASFSWHTIQHIRIQFQEESVAVPKAKDNPCTYADYAAWPEGERWELIEGVPYDMSPAPKRRHQDVLLNLARVVSNITDKGPCETYIAPFDVRLSEKADASDEEVITVVQPDLSVFCKPDRLDDRGAHAAPDLAVEVLSESTGYKDQTVKLSLYEKYGVREYWLVNGEVPWIMVYRLGPEGKYGKPDYYQPGEKIRSEVLESAIETDRVFT